MQRTMFVNQAAAFPKAAATPARIAPAAATCQLKQQDSMLTLKQGLAVAGALLSLTMVGADGVAASALTRAATGAPP